MGLPLATVRRVIAQKRRRAVTFDFAGQNAPAVDLLTAAVRTTLGTAYDSAGNVVYGPHNLLPYSDAVTSWTANGTPSYLGSGVTIDGFATLSFTATGGGYYRAFSVNAGDKVTFAYYVARTAGTAELQCGTDSFGLPSMVFDPGNGTFLAGPAAKGATAVSGGWLVWGTYTAPTSGSMTSIFYVYRATVNTYSIAAWANFGNLQPYKRTSGAAYFGLRLTYDPATLVGLGYLNEAASINYAFNTSALNNWTQYGLASLTQNASPSLFNDGSADILVPSTTSGQHYVSNNFVGAAAVGSPVAVSGAVKGHGVPYAFIYVTGIGSSTVVNGYINLSTGAVSNTNGGGTWRSKKRADGVIRFEVTYPTATSANIGMELHGSLDGNSFVYAGDGTSGLAFSDIQVERQAFATSPIPNPGGSGTSVVRAADNYPITGALFSKYVAQLIANGGTLVLSFRNPTLVSGRYPGVLELGDGTPNNRFGIYISPVGNLTIDQRVSGASVGAATSAGMTSEADTKVALSFTPAGLFKASVNGGAQIQFSGQSVAAYTRLLFCNFDDPWNSTVRSVQAYPYVRTDLQALSA